MASSKIVKKLLSLLLFFLVMGQCCKCFQNNCVTRPTKMFFHPANVANNANTHITQLKVTQKSIFQIFCYLSLVAFAQEFGV